MKKFIGTKVIIAEPMTMVEAQKVLGRELKPATVEEDGYLVKYKDGYKSWSPKSVFEEAYREVGSVNFGGAIDLLKAGLAVRRKGWNGKGLFIVKQVPSHITGDIIPNMQSLPQSAKSILMNRENPHIDYTPNGTGHAASRDCIRYWDEAKGAWRQFKAYNFLRVA